MGLDIPDLDDKEYTEIVEDLRKRIPVHTDEWTDHNAHDPGITILETLAWLAETYTYQLDRVTDAHRRKHLKLLGVQPRPPVPASVDLLLEPEDENRQGDHIEEGKKVIVDDGAEFTGVFETTKPITLTQTSIERVVTKQPDKWIDNTTANETYGMSFLAFGPLAARGTTLYLGLDSDPFGNADVDIIDVTVDYDDADLPEVTPPEDDDSEFQPLHRVTWQYCTDYENWNCDENWEDFGIRRDQTKHFYQGGTVALEKGDGWQGDTRDELMFDDDNSGRYRIEGRNEADGRSTEGAVEDKDADEATGNGFVWIRCKVVRSGYDIPPALNSVRLDVVPAQHKSRVEGEELHRPDGGMKTTAKPGQMFEFEHSPVLEAEIKLRDSAMDNEGEDEDSETGDHEDQDEVKRAEGEATESDRGESWVEVEDFDASSPDDRHFVLDHERGAIRFGDGVRGKVPNAGKTVIAESYVYGGGESGNVPRSSSCQFAAEEEDEDAAEEANEDQQDDQFEDIAVSLTDGAEGGADGESVQEAVARLRAELEAPDRAVSLEDYSEVAKQTPGVRFGRATAFVAESDDSLEPGGHDEVRVVVVPYSPYTKPRPSKGFLQAVQRHLDRRRLLTDRVQVEKPIYVGIQVETTVRIAQGYSERGRIAAVETALDEFLDPLGRANDDPWPFGRTVYKSELYEVIATVEGVEVVLDVSIFCDDAGEADLKGNVLLDDAALPYPDGHAVAVERDFYRGDH